MHTLKDFGVTKYVGKLKNGVRVVLFHRPNAPISTSIGFKAGAQFDPKGRDGLAHFTEHMFFQKTEKFESASEVSGFIEKMGGYLNAWTNSDSIRFVLEISDPNDYSKVAFFVDQVFGHLMIEDGRVENERGVILREHADKQSNPSRNIYTITDLLMFRGSSIGRAVLGTEETIKAIETKDLQGYYKDRLSLDDMSIVVSGDLDLDLVIADFNKGLSIKESEFKEKKVSSPKFLPKEDEKRILIETYKDTDQIHLSFGFRTDGYFSEDRIPLQVLSVICGHGFTSSLFEKLRNKNGLVYGLRIDYWKGASTGNWNLITSTPKSKLQKLLDITSGEFERVYKGKIEISELRLAKDKMIKAAKRRMQSSGSWVSFHEFGELFDPENALDLDKYLNEIEKITLEDLKRVATKYFKPGSWYLALCGDIEEKDFKVNY